MKTLGRAGSHQSEGRVPPPAWRRRSPPLAARANFTMAARRSTSFTTATTPSNYTLQMWQPHVLAVALGVQLLAGHALAAVPPVYSELWGRDGELWDPAGPLPDFSFAGKSDTIPCMIIYGFCPLPQGLSCLLPSVLQGISRALPRCPPRPSLVRCWTLTTAT